RELLRYRRSALLNTNIARSESPRSAIRGLGDEHMKTGRRKFLASAAAVAAGSAALSAAQDDDVSRLGRAAPTRVAVNCEMWFSRLPFVRRLEEAARLGFSAIEFWPWQGKNIAEIAKTCQKLKLEVAQFTAWGFTPGLNDPKNHGRFLEAIEA